MLYLLPINSLRVGMYVVDICAEWHKHQTLFSQEGFISSIEHLEAIRRSGFTEAYVNLQKSKPGTLPPGIADLLQPLAHDPFQNTAFTPSVPLQEECAIAKTLYSDSLKLSKKIEQDALKGHIDIDLARPSIDAIYDSLDRNHDALIGLSKLRQADEYTYTHSVNVSIFSILLAKALGGSKEDVQKIGLGALFHDYGKYFIPRDIVYAPRQLTPEEFEVMKQHPALGAKALELLDPPAPFLVQIANEHHERHDGKGYPQGLSGNAISSGAAIVSIADVFDALTSERPYKKPFPLNRALSIIYASRGQAHAALYVDHFIRILGVFPFGTVVKLSDNRVGIVSQSSMENALQPKVLVIFDHKGRRVIPYDLEHSDDDPVKIECAIAPQSLGINPAAELNLPI